MEERKGKLLKAEKLIINGVHYSKESEYGLFYSFTLTFDNGDVGAGRSKSEQGSFRIGDEYTYNMNVFNNNGYENKSFSSLKNLSKPFTGGGRKKESAETMKQIMNQVALITTNMVMKKIDKEYLEVYKELRKWLYTQVFDNGEDSRTVSGIIKIAGTYFEMIDSTSVKLESIVKFADSLIKVTKDISWESQSQKSTEKSNPEQPQQQTLPLPENKMTIPPPDAMKESDLPF